MSPSDLEEYIQQTPLPTLRLTLSSGDQLIVSEEDTPILAGLTLVLRGRAASASGRAAGQPRLVSMPNIVLVEPVERRTTRGRR